MTPGLVSVVLSTHNGANTLTRCLDSVADQTYKHFEIVCINDASIDATAKVLQQWEKSHPQIKLKINHHTVNAGLTRSLNEAIKLSGGEFIARIDDDDWWTSDKLSKQIDYLTNNPEIGIIGCWYINHRQDTVQKIRLPSNNNQIRREIFRHNPFGHSCIIIRREVLNKSGHYDEKLRYGQDRELWFRLLPITKMENIREFLCHRTIDTSRNYGKQKRQIIQQLKTVDKYIRLYHASPFNYFYLLEPLSLLIVPTFFKKIIWNIKSQLSHLVRPAKKSL